MITQQDIEKIMEAVRIEDVVGEFVELRKRGVNYIGLCPFHNEKTPSFNVNPARGIFKCFGCGEGGDAVSFLMKINGFSYPEALRYLAQKYGIEIQEKTPSPQEQIIRDEKERLYDINEFACNYFHNNLISSQQGQAVGMSYFRQRELEVATINDWKLGYSSENAGDFVSFALSRGYKEDLLIQSGLCIKNERDGSLFDRFYGRIIFPIYNISGRVLGFSGRILSNDKKKAKYVNSPESPIYTKGKTLFGLNFARGEITKQDVCYLVEGNVDAIMMYQKGVKNTVASCGTALTEDQIRLIKRYTDNVTVLYDGDAAGIHAAIRATDMFLKEGMHVRIVLFPDGDDPDSFARKHSAQEFKEFLDTNSQNFIIYKTNLLLEQAGNDPLKRASLIKEIVNSIALIPDAIERTTYIQQCSQLMSVKEDILISEINKKIFNIASKISPSVNKNSNNIAVSPAMQSLTLNTKTQNVEKRASECEVLERNVIRILLNYADRTTKQPVLINNELKEMDFNAGEFIINDIVSNDIKFTNPVYSKIFNLYLNRYNKTGEILSYKELLQLQDETAQKEIASLLMEPARMNISSEWEKYGIFTPDIQSRQSIDKDIKFVTLSMKLYKINMMMKDLKERMKTESEADILSMYNKLRVIRDNIAKELNFTVMSIQKDL